MAKHLFSFLLFVNTYVVAQVSSTNCNNIDFGAGNYSNWIGQWNNASSAMNETDIGTGQVYGYGALTVNGLDSGRFNKMHHVHEFCNGGVDPNVPINRVAPGHTVSVRLGSDSAYGAALAINNNPGGYTYPAPYPFYHQTISNTFSVTTVNQTITYWYAVVLDQTGVNGHPPASQPYFRISLFDSSKQEITCARLDVNVTRADTIGGFQIKYDTTATYQFFYKDWTPVVISLSPYIGQKLTITFETSDCDRGGHFGYAYIAADCGIDTTHTATCNAGIEKHTNAPTIAIYPNPVKENFFVETTDNNKRVMRLFDVSGKLVLQQTTSTKTMVDVSHLQKGIYTLSISGNEGTINKKLILTGN